MLTAYINAAMKRACYEVLKEDGSFVGTIRGFQGVWASAKTLEGCRRELQEVLEDWIVIGLRLGHELPEVDGLEFATLSEAL